MPVAKQPKCKLVGLPLFCVSRTARLSLDRISDGLHFLIDQYPSLTNMPQADMGEFMCQDEELSGVLTGLVSKYDHGVPIDLQRHSSDALAPAGKLFQEQHWHSHAPAELQQRREGDGRCVGPGANLFSEFERIFWKRGALTIHAESG